MFVPLVRVALSRKTHAMLTNREVNTCVETGTRSLTVHQASMALKRIISGFFSHMINTFPGIHSRLSSHSSRSNLDISVPIKSLISCQAMF